MNQRQAGSMGDELTNAALIGLIGMFGIALVLRAAGSVAAYLTGTTQPDAGAAAGLACSLFLRAVAKPLVGIVFGPDFAPAVPLLERLSLALPAAFGMMVVGTVFAAWRRQILAMWALAAAFVLSTALNFAWIPVIGAMACADAAIAAYSLAAVVMAAQVLAAARPGSNTT